MSRRDLSNDDPATFERESEGASGEIKDADVSMPAAEQMNGVKPRADDFIADHDSIIIEELPGILTKEQFTELANYKSRCCVTIFLGVHPVGVEVNEDYDPINLKNQLQEAAQRLQTYDYNVSEIKHFLEPAYDLVANKEFWTEQAAGLGIFISEGYFKFIRMPVAPVEELLVLEPTFYVTPLIPVITRPEYFYVLVISKQCAKLFKADAWGMRIVPVDLPQSIQEVKRLPDLDATTFRSGSNGSRGPRYSQEGVYHGTGGGNPGDKDNMLVYFEAVDDILWDKVLHNENAPLLLAAVEYEIPIYRSACDYHNVWPQALTGSREHQGTYALYKDAMEVMKPYFEQKTMKALELYANNSTNGKTSSIAADVIPATYYSQVSHLFVTRGEHIWGTFNEMSNELWFHESPNEKGEDLIDNAVVKTLANGGEVYLLDREQMPAECQIAAVMRF